MTDNRFAKTNLDDPGTYLLSLAGVVLLCSGAIHDNDASAKGKERAGHFIRELLDAARAAGYTRGQIAETVLLDYGQPLDRKKAVALEMPGIVGNAGFIASMRSAGFSIGQM